MQKMDFNKAVKQWNCDGIRAIAINPYIESRKGKFTIVGTDSIAQYSNFESWASDPANQPVTDLDGIFNSEQVKEVWELKDIDSDFWILEAKLSPENSTYEYFEYYYKMLSNDIETRRRLVPCNTDSIPEVIVSKIESPAQITIGDTSFTKLTDGFIQILTKNGCVELVSDEIEELYKFIK